MKAKHLGLITVNNKKGAAQSAAPLDGYLEPTAVRIFSLASPMVKLPGR